MRRCIPALALAGGLLSAGAAVAQGLGMGMAGTGMSPRMQGATAEERFGQGQIELPTARQVYVQQLARLRSKMLRIAAADGGQLSEAHKAALQQELDAINRSYAANSPAARR